MNIYKLFFIIILSSLNIIFLQNSIAKSTKVSYVVDEDKNECTFITDNQKILLAGGDERTYFFFPCFGFEATYEVNTTNKKYFISELLLAPTPRNNAIFVRSIEGNNNKFKDNNDLSYFLISCISMKKGGNKLLISYLLNNLESYKKICNTENGYITLDKKTFLYDYDKKNNKFMIRKSYLIKGDKITVSDYLFKDNVLWILATYNNTTKKWIQLKL